MSSICSLAHTFDCIISNTKLIKKPIPTGEEFTKANYAKFHYCVEKTDSGPRLKKSKYCGMSELTLKARGITFIGENKGEFGGGLTAILNDSEKVKLLDENIVKLVEHDGIIYVFTGLAHLGMKRGAVYKIEIINNQPKVERITLLNDAPEVVLSRLDSRDGIWFTIVSSEGISTFSPRFEKFNVLAVNQFWGGLYPSSAAIYENKLIIGIRSGIAVVDFNITLHSNNRFEYRSVKKVEYYGEYQ